MPKFRELLKIVPKYIVFIIALAGTLGSLYFSEIFVSDNGTQGLTPCPLCWYQRILLYPMAIIMLVAVFRKDTKVHLYTAPMAFLGLLIAAYHYLIQKTTIFGTEFVACRGGAACNKIDFEVGGFITIPLMSFAAFLIILICNYLMYKFGVKYE